MATQHDKVDRIVAVLLAQVPEDVRYDVALRFQRVTTPHCKADGCGKWATARGYCTTHYKQLQRHGAITTARCVVSGCTGANEAHGYCQKHYKRFQKYGSPYIVRGKRVECNRLPTPDTLPVATCQVDGCNGPMQAKGMCMKHYQRERRKHAA